MSTHVTLTESKHAAKENTCEKNAKAMRAIHTHATEKVQCSGIDRFGPALTSDDGDGRTQ